MASAMKMALACGLGAVALGSAPALAQRSGEIVQPLPPEGTSSLNDALRRLARDSRDVEALLDAGDASLKVGDIDAAIGFFGRAEELAPGHSRIKLGLARAYVTQRRPVEALRLFAEAESAGVANQRMAAERGLAFDLVGDSASAQQLYRLGIAAGGDDELTRRLALSLAIAGNRDAFEDTLRPLLVAGDLSAFRARAFGLAILGDTDEALSIAQARLPVAVVAQLAPYLRYMPQLTRAQQAAAANMGVFPRASNMGRDEEEIAAYDRPPVRIARNVDAQLAPTGPTMGSTMPPQAAPAPRPARTERPARSERRATTEATPREPRPRAERAQPRETAPRERVVSRAVPTEPMERTMVRPLGQTVAPARPAQAEEQPATLAQPAPVEQQQPVIVAARGELPAASATPPPPAQTAPVTVATAPVVEDVAGAFADLDALPRPSATGGVDITSIAIPREVDRPAPPAHPARHWVQVATGRDRSALAFDWRRIARSADGKLDGKGPYVARWGEANRLLSGPYDSAAEAREMMNALKGLGLDSFTFSSAAGEEVVVLK